MAHHNVRVIPNSNGTYGWYCVCGGEADEFEDYDSADDNATEHLRHTVGED